jgi:hypothetical protein
MQIPCQTFFQAQPNFSGTPSKSIDGTRFARPDASPSALP